MKNSNNVFQKTVVVAMLLSVLSAASTVMPDSNRINYCQQFVGAYDPVLSPKADANTIVTWFEQAAHPKREVVGWLLDDATLLDVEQALNYLENNIEFGKFRTTTEKRACKDYVVSLRDTYAILKDNLKSYKRIAVPDELSISSFSKDATVGTDFAEVFDDTGKVVYTLKNNHAVERIKRTREIDGVLCRRIRFKTQNGEVRVGWIREDVLIRSDMIRSEMTVSPKGSQKIDTSVKFGH